MSSPNPYELLEVSPTASAEEIKSAYLRLAKQWHPDRYSGPEKAKAEQRFRELNEAYTTVKDPSKRGSVPPPAPKAQEPEPPAPAPVRASRTAGDWYDDAKTAFDQADHGRALALVQYAIRQDDRKAPFFVLQGQALEALGDARKALKSYESALQLNPKDPDILIRMADLYATEGLKARSEASLQAARRLAPNHKRFKAPKAPADAKGKGKSPASQASLTDQAKALWSRLTGKG